jgi:hypothetical protein
MRWVRAGVEEEEWRLAEEVVAWKSNLVLGAVISSTSSNGTWRTSLFVVEQSA